MMLEAVLALQVASAGDANPEARLTCLPPGARMDEYQARALCARLAAAGKGRLDGPAAYRVVYAPAFRPAKIVEARKERSGWLIQTTVMSWTGHPEHGAAILERRQRWLTEDEAVDLHWTAERSGVWRADSHLRVTVLDDSSLVFEALRPGVHRLHTLWRASNADTRLHELGALLYRLGGVANPEH